MLAAGEARAENEGQADLDRATEVKLAAKTASDLADVIRLLEGALEKGLDEENTRFANSLLASTLIQRGSVTAKMVLLIAERDPEFAQRDPRFAERRKAALDDLEKGVKLHPQQPEALYFIARISLLSGGDTKRAAEALREAVELSADRPLFRAKALLLRASIEKDPEKKMADLDDAVSTVPDDPAPLRARGLLRADMGKFQEALTDLDKAIELDPKHINTYEAKAIVLTRMKKYDEALVSLDKAHELVPNSILPLLQKARIHGLQSNLDAALHELDRAHSMHPENVAVLLLRAGAHRDNGQHKKALADADRALKLKPKLPGAMRLRAVLLVDADKLNEAIAQLEELRRAHPQDMLGLLQLGMLYVQEERHDQAIEAYSAVLAERPEVQLALRGRGDALLNVGKHKPAIADYETLIKLQPKDPGTLNNLAWVLATSPRKKLRDGKRAVALAAQACELTDYKAAHILSTLGAAYAETGDFETAIKWVEKGLEVTGGDEKEALEKELENYRAGKPFRELLSAGKPEKPHDEQPQQ
jgi:tetratricopeptide (TPR) repeat protein